MINADLHTQISVNELVSVIGAHRARLYTMCYYAACAVTMHCQTCTDDQMMADFVVG